MSDEKIVSLSNGKVITPPGEAIPHVVEACEVLLEKAKSGELLGFAIVEVTKSYNVSCGWYIAGGAATSNAICAGLIDLNYGIGKYRDPEGEE